MMIELSQTPVPGLLLFGLSPDVLTTIAETLSTSDAVDSAAPQKNAKGMIDRVVVTFCPHVTDSEVEQMKADLLKSNSGLGIEEIEQLHLQGFVHGGDGG